MKRSLLCLLTLVALIGMSVGHARDTRLRISIEEAMTTPDAESKLNAGIRFFFGDQEHPEIERQLGTYTSNKKTNAFGKSDQKACKWAFLSAMITFQERAIAEGGNAVVNIRSNYKQSDFSSTTEFECGAGAVMAGVTLVGEVVKLAE